MHAMNSQSAIYAGDSMEDLLMAKRAQTGGLKITFVGVYGMSPDPLETKKLFSNQVGTVAKTVNSLPTLMNRL
jgi:phosphoglycolate phosphatase-like HAD superfamily hydrolase